ncbi:hypothetical protein QTP88_001488 [Uroleucon formosanum]
MNKGNFLELLKLLSKHRGPLNSHLQKIEVIKDTTTDVSILEHFTFLLRYVNDKGKIEERLVALVTSPNSTGKGMYEVLCNITEKYNINWKRDLCAQAYDGAASMQGQYSGLKT